MTSRTSATKRTQVKAAADTSEHQIAGDSAASFDISWRTNTHTHTHTHTRKNIVSDKHPRRHATLEPTHRTYSTSSRHPRRHATLVQICYTHISFESMGARQSVARPPEDQDELSVRGQLCVAGWLYVTCRRVITQPTLLHRRRGGQLRCLWMFARAALMLGTGSASSSEASKSSSPRWGDSGHAS